MKKYLKLFRVKHYIKNLLVFIPLIFSKNLFNKEKIISAMIGFISFSLMSSAVYIINDIKDAKKDMNHPVKKSRPIASGEISIFKALIISIISIVISILITVYCCINFNISIALTVFYLFAYLVLNISYSIGLKNKPILDIALLVLGFLIRVLYGGAIVQVEVSSWLYLTIISISFYLALGKRRNEFIKHDGKDTREVLKYYTKEFLDKNMYVSMALAICFYALWAMNYGNNLMICTVPIVMLLAMKYSLDIEEIESEGDPVEVIIKDKFIICLGIIYVCFILGILYF